MTTKMIEDYRRARKQWDVIRLAEGRFRLPDCLLFAVGSRETNLTNVVGDFGHGHGVFQLDDRSHVIEPGFDQSVTRQAYMAGGMLCNLLEEFEGDLGAALASYNAGAGAVRDALSRGQRPDSVTTGANYGQDVLARMADFHRDHLQQKESQGPKR